MHDVHQEPDVEASGEYLTLKPWTDSDRAKIVDFCQVNRCRVVDDRDPQGNICVELGHITRGDFLSGLREEHVKFELQPTARHEAVSTPSALGLLRELLKL